MSGKPVLYARTSNGFVLYWLGEEALKSDLLSLAASVRVGSRFLRVSEGKAWGFFIAYPAE
jgi:hypothetical protein